MSRIGLFMGTKFRELGFTKDFAGMNLRKLSLTKNFAVIYFLKNFAKINFAFAIRKIFFHDLSLCF